jgi:YidC/Oxa1 family membrane protein insertase
MRSNIVNVLVFVVAAAGLWFLLDYAGKHWLPKPQKKDLTEEIAEAARKQAEETKQYREIQQARIAQKIVLSALTGGTATAIEPAKTPEVAAKEPTKPSLPPRPNPTLIELGNAGFNLHVLLNTRGGGVQQVILTKFDAADRLGREVKEKDANGNPIGKGVPLYLIPGEPLFRTKHIRADYIPPELKPGVVRDPSSLSEPSYTIFHYATPEDKYPDPFLGETEWKVVSTDRKDDLQTVVFEAELGDPYFVKIRKTYTLSPGDYHIGFKLDIERQPGWQKGKGSFRYQISGPRGLPIEGEWYTTSYREALIGWVEAKGKVERQSEDAATISIKRGGELVNKGENTFKYMAITTQYFASALAIDDTAEGSAKNPWAFVRATTEMPFDKQANPNMAYFDDVTVRAVSDIVNLDGGNLTHSYVIYNGPSKVRLLGLMEGDRTVDPALVERYQTKLGLETIKDFPSTMVGRFVNRFWWVDIVIICTNLMHWLLSSIHSLFQGWAFSIIILTVMVRILLLIPSRKQTQMNMKMVEIQKRLAPQIEEMKKKYGDDFNTFNREKMRLLMANGMNPAAQMGGCFLLILQMPVMMGLYFCLQESIFFRLEPFLWIKNLSAPDMTLWWSEKIPYVSTPEDIGSFYYLGPYLNVLPLIAVGLMLWQQSKMMPPRTDENAPDPKTMMRVMMIMMAVMFYKVAAGLALYFIVGSVWGLLERRYFITHPPKDDTGTPAGSLPKVDSPNGQPAAPEATPGMFGRMRDAMQKRMEELKKQADEQSKRQIRNDPDKKHDRKKKRRK